MTVLSNCRDQRAKLKGRRKTASGHEATFGIRVAASALARIAALYRGAVAIFTPAQHRHPFPMQGVDQAPGPALAGW